MMTVNIDQLLFIGSGGKVRAVDKTTGEDAWTTSLPSTGYDVVTLLCEGGMLFAGSKGYIFGLDPRTGEILWKNGLTGLGYNQMTLATTRQATSLIEIESEERSNAQSNSSSSSS